MAKQAAIEQDGIIVEALSNAMFRVDLDGGIDIALAGVAADGAAVEGGDGGLAVDGGSLGSIGDILEQLLHKVHSSCK